MSSPFNLFYTVTCVSSLLICADVEDVVPKSYLRKNTKYSNCNCKSTTCSKLKNYKYVQPKKSECFKPKSAFDVCNEPLDKNSIYSKSYPYYDPNIMNRSRQEPIIHRDNLKIDGEFIGNSIHQMSYQVVCPSKVQKIKPKDHSIMGEGYMRLLTTQKHDYYDVLKDQNRNESIKPCDNLHLNEGPMDSQTTNRFSFKPIEVEPVKLFKPLREYITPTGEMNLETVTKCSYVPHEPVEKTEIPWAIKLEYCKPNKAVECCSVYNESYPEPGTYILKDLCNNIIEEITEGKTGEDCCPFQCLADNAEEKFKTQFIKAHHFDN